MSKNKSSFANLEEDDGYVFFRVPVDDATVARLMVVADESHCDPVMVISSILHDTLKDDEYAHMIAERPFLPN